MSSSPEADRHMAKVFADARTSFLATFDQMQAGIRDMKVELAKQEVSDVPNQPKTPARSIRIEGDLWRKAQERAAERGETVTDAIRKFLERYTR